MTLNRQMEHWEKENGVDLYDLSLTDEEGRTLCELYYEKTGDVPIVLEVEVPTTYLYFDEDIAYARAIREQIDNGVLTEDNLDYKVSLQQFTCSSVLPITPAMIKSVQVVAYYDMDAILTNKTSYGQLYESWINGFPIDKFVLNDAKESLLAYMEDNHLGAFDEVPLSNNTPHFRYEDSAVFVD